MGGAIRNWNVALEVSLEANKLHWLYYENQAFKRENYQTILQGKLDINLQFWINNNFTFVGREGQVIVLNSQQVVSQLAVDHYQHQLMFRCNEISHYWLSHGQLLRQGKLGSEYIGDVLEQQTQFWIGSRFGFGLYQAGKIKVAFVFKLDQYLLLMPILVYLLRLKEFTLLILRRFICSNILDHFADYSTTLIRKKSPCLFL